MLCRPPNIALSLLITITKQWAVKKFLERENLRKKSWIRTRDLRVVIQYANRITNPFPLYTIYNFVYFFMNSSIKLNFYPSLYYNYNHLETFGGDLRSFSIKGQRVWSERTSGCWFLPTSFHWTSLGNLVNGFIT